MKHYNMCVFVLCVHRLHDALDELLPEAFATVREASRRVLGMRHFDSQLVGEQQTGAVDPGLQLWWSWASAY